MLVLGVESDIGGLFATIALLEWSCKAKIYNKVILEICWRMCLQSPLLGGLGGGGGSTHPKFILN